MFSRTVLSAKDDCTRITPGKLADIVVLNAGAGLVVGGAADDLAAGIERAASAIDSGPPTGATPLSAAWAMDSSKAKSSAMGHLGRQRTVLRRYTEGRL